MSEEMQFVRLNGNMATETALHLFLAKLTVKVKKCYTPPDLSNNLKS